MIFAHTHTHRVYIYAQCMIYNVNNQIVHMCIDIHTVCVCARRSLGYRAWIVICVLPVFLAVSTNGPVGLLVADERFPPLCRNGRPLSPVWSMPSRSHAASCCKVPNIEPRCDWSSPISFWLCLLNCLPYQTWLAGKSSITCRWFSHGIAHWYWIFQPCLRTRSPEDFKSALWQFPTSAGWESLVQRGSSLGMALLEDGWVEHEFP